MSGMYTYEDNSILRSIIHWIVDIAVVISFAWFVVYGYLNQTIVNGHSMSPTLEAEDMCLVDRIAYAIGAPERFDIVVFTREDTGQTNIKRVIGLPGEQLQIISGVVYIDGEPLEDSRLDHISLAGIAENPVVLQEDEYFLIGDNADSSEDSRFSNIGNVKRENILGRIWFRVRPLEELGFIE